MTTNSSYASVQNIGHMGSTFRALIPLRVSSLLAKVNWVFMLYIGCVAAGTAYCLSNLYQAYQLKFNHSFELDNRFKLIKCQALFEEGIAKERSHDGPLFQQCELLLASVGNEDFTSANLNNTSANLNKNALLLKLALHYAGNDPDHSYQIAQKLTSSSYLFEVAQSIQQEHPNFDSDKLNLLFTQAFGLMMMQHRKKLLRQPGINQWLNLAKAFRSVQNNTSFACCMQEALHLADHYADDLSQIKALCQIAKFYSQPLSISNAQKQEACIEQAQALFRERKMQPAEQIEARLAVADVFYSIGAVTQMDQELSEIMKLMDKMPSLEAVNSLYSLIELIIKIQENNAYINISPKHPQENVASDFKNFGTLLTVDKVLKGLENSAEAATAKNRAQAYLSIAKIFHENLISHSGSKEEALSRAFNTIQSLSENEIESKFDLLLTLVDFYRKDSEKIQEILQILEGLYDRSPLNGDFELGQNKFEWGRQIMSCYQKLKLNEQFHRFFQKYLSDLKNEGKRPFDKISNLVIYARHDSTGNDHYLPEQRRAQLEAAESLLPELKSSSSYELALAMVIEGYLQVDPQKSLMLLNNYAHSSAHQKALKSLKVAAITTVTTGLFYFYPQACPVWALGLTIVRLF